MAEKQTAMTPAREERRPARTTARGFGGGPFTMLQRLSEEMDRMFEDFGFGRRWRSPLWRGAEETLWAPDIDVVQKENQLIIKADLPGLRKEDVTIDVTEDAVIIQGERKTEREEEREGVYRSERSYGSFYRAIPLPEGAIADEAKAQFRDGVLEITMPAPPASKGRRLEIAEASQQK